MKRTFFLILILFSLQNVNAQQKKTEKATFGMGCFWCTEALFERLKGVSNVKSGYEGGDIPNPTYEQVCTGTTNHAEVIEMNYDPTLISYEELLEVFWKSHDPTTLNRQGADEGTQYRSVIFYHSKEQKEIAERYKSTLNKEKAFKDPIVTTIEKADTFYVAENYHQDYFIKNGEAPYCKLVILPKMEKLEKLFKSKMKN
ncbi:MAG: peptide-methionine (S)-S-oxide reductase [Pedobacter sp.]|nr:MAG: peptide-methionine (S)-S-oxide reductase [Pedobacter sp.]